MKHEPNYTAIGLVVIACLTVVAFGVGFYVKDLPIAHGASHLASHGQWKHAAAVGFAIVSVAACVLLLSGLVVWVVAEGLINVWKVVYAVGVGTSFLVKPKRERGNRG